MSLKSILGKYVLPAAGVASMFIPGVGPAVRGALGTVGKGLSSPIGRQGLSLGLGALGNILGARAANQPEAWRQKLIEEELARRNAYQQAGIPSLMGALGYRTPQAGQNLTAQLGRNR